MSILLDTHILLWWDSDPSRLTPTASALCHDPANTLVVSHVSAWEMQIKRQLGKLDMRLPLADLLDEQRATNGIELLPISLSHILALGDLPPHHKDPFDRLLIAQANVEGLALLSADGVFDQYEVELQR